MRVLIACEFSGAVRRAFADEGIEVREMPGFPGYAVSRCGRVFSCNHPTGRLPWYKELRLSTDAKGYRGLTLCGQRGRVKKRVHRLVAELFVPNPRNLPCVRHLNGVPSDNRADNLAWGTYADNEADKRVHGTWDTRRNGKLNEAHIAKARQWARNGISQRGIAEKLGVSRPTITRLLNGSTWGNVPCEY